MKFKFKCPKCGCIDVEEVMTDVVQYSLISVIEENDGKAAVDYASNSCDGGNVDHYQCHGCSFVLATEEPHSWNIHDEEELIEWCLKNCKQTGPNHYDHD
jgi:hypothetical protein